MSFNRGVKRDSFGNRGNFNRGGSGGGGGGGNRVGNNSGMGGMNPWEGGMMPGRGILPTPNNNLSLASPQAQLAIASNLLTNLLRSQQEAQPQVPSLMSLGNNYSGPGPNYPNQQNYSSGRFNDRVARHPMKNQRPQPYNKMGNRARDGPAGRRGPSAQQSRAPQSGSQRMNGNQIQHRNDKSSKPIPASKQNQTAKKEQQDVKTSDSEKAEPPVPKSNDADESEDKKRDWKDEKNTEEKVVKMEDEKTEDSEKKLDKSAAEDSPSKEGKDTSEKTEKENTKMTGKKSEVRHAESRYFEVPMNHMFCHICNKHMWDGFSFENHLRGRAHQLMMEKLDESYKLKVDLMRHELRVAEEQRELSLNNSKRRGKKVSVDFNVREYCTMCDLNFYGTLSTHRKSEKHQQLKTFLHPRCFPCLKEFPSRIEYDEHCLTPAHMKNFVQCEEQRKNKKKEKLAKGEAEVRTAEDEEKDVYGKFEKEEDLGEQEYITDIVENITEKKFKIPSYKYCRQNQIFIGKAMVKEVQGFYCERCRRFMLSAEDMNAHLRSITHYRNFVAEVKSLTSTVPAAESKEAEQAESEKNTEDVKDECDIHWKRRKISHDENEENDKPEEQQENSADNANVAPKRSDGEEKYDPLEADAAESEEEENREAEENAKETTAGNTANTQDVKQSVDEMWTDTENDNDTEMGNLIDEAEEKEHTEQEKSASAAPKVERNRNPQVKQARGRGFARGRGGPRARRSRR
ncbi:PREDICTED: zinc finger protein on ecdysone puffs [Vollenhovia emeryi]|uniref:zinc finger protein on ecdysone puffs n=1 Tax=Vollenhovia emeryi TaxID=411798 RepID=UPI0005F54136|nr:PREDICTED: zinc finger protein on ecdysone puffs [Vollenhovia emeryi]XP_011870268.1 PREDICTED: zinc finger protein on ecdysone puffs [Vollenhovia emeryi]